MPGTPTAQEAAEKRRLERIRLFSPLHAFVGTERVTLIDVSPIGARIETATSLGIGAIVEVTLRLGDDSMNINATVVRSRLDRSITRDAIVYDTGLEFDDLPAEQSRTLRDLIRETARFDLDARRKYARGRGGSSPR